MYDSGAGLFGERKRMNKSNHLKYQQPLLVAVLVILVILCMSKIDTTYLFDFIKRYEKASVLISLLVYTLLGATLIPSEPLTLFLINLYGPWPAALIATVGNTLAAFLEFSIGGNIGDVAEFEKQRARLPFHLGDIPIQSPLFLLLGRMLPGYGPKFISLACGIYKVPLSTYAWTTFVSNLLGAVFVAFGGYGLLKLL